MSQNKCTRISNNTYFYFEFFSDFLKKKPEIPLCNRDYIEERVNEFYNKLINYNNELNDDSIPYLNIIHTALLNNILYICDGQHRYYALKKYYDEKK